MKLLRKTVGASLLASPFFAIIVFESSIGNFKAAIFAVGFVVLVVAVVWFGVGLFMKD